ncbi:hypothetical protein [Deinococcus seoulensis]|uniref:hypothetical protein n=1 Tax=Deinococcus seoulensis TaxID=1837379 RepID=UPI00166DD251|nr:hypothetical protein [Deinococcus seoulensis]
MFKKVLPDFKITLALMLLGSASAAGLMGSSQSFSTSDYCKAYSCTMISNKNGTWMYKNKYGDLISIKRQTSDPGSRIVSAIVAIDNADPDYFGSDQKMVNSLQITLYGKIISSFPQRCYYAEDEAHIFAEFNNMGSAKRFGCVNINDGSKYILIVGLGGDQPLR